TAALILTVTSIEGKLSTFTINQASSGAAIGVLPTNSNTNYFSQTVTEHVTAQLHDAWRVSQSLRFGAFVPFDQSKLADTYQVAGELGFDRIFRVDALGLVARAELADFVQPRDPTTDVPLGFDQRQVLLSLVGRWRRDWSPSWSTEAALGGVAVVGSTADPTATTQTAWRPSALAALRWSRDVGSAVLRYSHEVSPNALAGRTFDTDGVALQAAFPVVRAKMYFGATVGYQHAQNLSLVAGGQEASAEVVLVDGTVGWTPIPELNVFARYALFDQFGSPPVMNMAALLGDITRHTVMLGLTVIYPAAPTALVATGPGTRVDRTDQPDFPEVHATEPK
ncbi:MAG TPA: hypothetical protein VHB97_06255, partial [Polyangia bacterium]|nr:hypothetical protein [Polyangia bacterium]